MRAGLISVVFSSLLATGAFAQSSTIQFATDHQTVFEDDGTIQINVVRTGSLSGSASVDYDTTGGSSYAAGDYVPASGTLTFGNQESEKTISLTLLDDATTNATPARTIEIVLSNHVHSSQGQFYAFYLEIKDDEPPLPPLTFSYDDLTFDEGDGVVQTYFTINLNRPHTETIMAGFRSYQSPAEYHGARALTSTGITFPPGITSVQIPLEVRGNDTYDGGATKSFHFSVQPGPVPIVAPDFDIILTEDDPEATVSVADVSVPEGSCGPTPIEITLTATAPVTGIVQWSSSDGTGTQSDIDWGPYGVYEPAYFTNSTTAKITVVAPYGDLKIEGDETFTVTLTSATNMAIGDGTATVTIENDDEELPHFLEDLVRVEAGQRTMLRIDFPAPAPAGSVLLSSSDSRVQVPASVSVPQQATFVTFPADATEAAGPVTVTASLAGALGATQITATVDAFMASDLRFDQPRRATFAGETAMASLDLNPPRNAPVTVKLEASSGIVVPESVDVPPGGFATFPFTSLAAGTGWITATYDQSFTSFEVDVSAQTLASFAPEIASTAGGSPVTLKGAGFSPGCTASFGDLIAETTFVDGETLIARTPAHAAQTVNLTVTCGITPVTAAKDFQFATPKRRASRH